MVDSEPGWHTEIVSFDPAQFAAVPDEADARRRLDEAQSVVNISFDAAVLLIWSALEGGLWSLSQRNARDPRPRPSEPRKLIRELLIDGLISDGQAIKLDDFAQIRNLAAHGWDASPKMQPEELDWFIEFAQQLFNDTIDTMVDWFLEHYESPGDAGIPYESPEGGYQWRGLGPHYPQDVLRDHFTNAFDVDIRQATDILENQSPCWVTRNGRD